MRADVFAKHKTDYLPFPKKLQDFCLRRRIYNKILNPFSCKMAARPTVGREIIFCMTRAARIRRTLL